MFEGVGENRSQGRGRQAGAMLASVLLNGGVIGLLIYFGNQVVEEVQNEIPVEVTFFQGLKQVLLEPNTRWFTIFVFLSMTAYFMQEPILEPYAGLIFNFSVFSEGSFSGF